MDKITSKYAIRQIMFDDGRFVIRKTTYVVRTSSDLDIFFAVHDRIWRDPKDTGTMGPICANLRSLEEAEHWVEGAESGQFVPIPLPGEFDFYPGLEERVKGGA